MPNPDHAGPGILRDVAKWKPAPYGQPPMTRVYCCYHVRSRAVTGGPYSKEAADQLVWECRLYHDQILKPKGFHWCRKNPYRDIGTVRTFNKSMTRRTQGKLCSMALQAGDVLILPNLALTFKTTKQMVDMVRGWVKRGVQVHMPELAFDSSTPLGEWGLNFAAALEQFRWERWQFSYPRYSVDKMPTWKPLAKRLGQENDE